MSSQEIQPYVDKAMYPSAEMENQYPTVRLLNATPDPLGSIAAMCRMYEGIITHSLGDISDNEREHYWSQVQKTHLKAPLEAVDLHFFIEGVTRSFTHQMVRQRTAVYAQESLRFAVKESIDARPGPIISQDRNSREIWFQATKALWDSYQHLIANGIPAEEARGLLPHDTLTRLHYKTNLRNLLEHAGNRLCTQAQFEWRLVFIGIVDAMSNCGGAYFGNTHHVAVDLDNMKAIDDVQTEKEFVDVNWQWKHIVNSNVFRPVCFQLGHCPFTAEFDRGCTIRDRVEAGKFDEIKAEEYMTDPTAGWVR